MFRFIISPVSPSNTTGLTKKQPIFLGIQSFSTTVHGFVDVFRSSIPAYLSHLFTYSKKQRVDVASP